MSGMYIRGEVPDSCRNCPIVNKTKSGLRCPIASRRKGFSCTVSFGIVGRPSYCPIGPVSDHGRLIDAVILRHKCYQHYEDFMNGKIDGKTALLNIEKEIIDAPTVIPASKEEADV